MNEQEGVFDLAIIGGGINGCGIAADAAGRGLSVYLCEQSDFASGTSSASSKLIHGGLRYLEHYEFRLVKEALAEREVLLRNAPHLVSPLKFCMPHQSHLRPSWMIRCGLFLYDHLSRKNSLPRAKMSRLTNDIDLRPSFKKCYEYYDCWVDDSRLVVANAMLARDRGAQLHTRTMCQKISYSPRDGLWQIISFDKRDGSTQLVQARNVINAAGPWLNKVLEDCATIVPIKRRIRLIKGSHIIVPKRTKREGAYILQNEDKRIVFVLPYLNDYSIIGTTDKEYTGDPAAVSIEQWETDYLLDIYNRHFNERLQESDIVASYSGVRPLCDDESSDPSAITRDYTLELHAASENNAFLSIYGGKITTYRKLAEAVLDKLSDYLPTMKERWTAGAPLPGAIPGRDRAHITKEIQDSYPWLPQDMTARFSQSYGLLCHEFLHGKQSIEELGQNFGATLTAAEVNYLTEKEWAREADDILWRRSKLGYAMSAAQQEELKVYLKKKYADDSLNSCVA